MAPTTVTVAYPKDATFKLDYYLSTHMPLASKSWTPYGLKSWKVVQVDDTNSPYGIIAFLEFDSQEDFTNAVTSPDTAAVMADVENFSDKGPVLMTGALVGSS